MSGRFDPITVFCRLIDGRGNKTVLVAEKGTGIVASLPRSQVSIEEGGFLPAAQSPGNYLRITMPLWLAQDRGFRTVVGEGQGALF